MSRPHYHFVTGRLAEPALRSLLADLAGRVGFDYSIDVLKITVAALMTTEWVAPRVHPPGPTEKILLPGYCRGELSVVEQAAGRPVERGPVDLRDLPEYFGQRKKRPEDYGRYDLEILAEINLAPRLPLGELLRIAAELRADGADLIYVGCEPGSAWAGISEAVRALRAEGHRVSVDSFDPREIADAAAAGAELVLSVNATNRQFAADWGIEVVAVPDAQCDLESLAETAQFLQEQKIKHRLDPILEPIGFGFARSLGRYLEVRQRFPEAEILMGIGNVTELTDVDSAGLNVLLLAFCQEQGIRSVLTTQVINWARSSVKECDLARRLLFHAVRTRTLPKHLEPQLILLRDPKLTRLGPAGLQDLASRITDPNFRLFAEDGELHLMNNALYLHDRDPFALFSQLQKRLEKPLDPGHAFYLGYELCKAVTALTLHKNYRQDQALQWGFLTIPERSHRGTDRGT